MARGDLAATLTAALSAPVAALVESAGSTCRVRRATSTRRPDKTVNVSWGDAPTVRVACVIGGLSAEKRLRAYGATLLADREGVVLRDSGVTVDDVLVVEAGPFAGEQLRVEAFGADVPQAGIRLVALVAWTRGVGL